MDATELDAYFRELLDIDAFAGIDDSVNGLQVGRSASGITKIAFAVDASLETIRRAGDAGAQALFVHHGILWGKPVPISGNLYGRVRELVRGDLALFACHLPLDAHPELGNNILIARALGLSGMEPFGMHKGKFIGWGGSLDEGVPFEALLLRAFPAADPPRAIYPFGKDAVRRVAVVSGGAASDVGEAIAKGYDLYITGEPSHSVYHETMEAGIHMASMGHYLTETFGVKAVSGRVSQDLGIETLFIDYPTGL